MELHLRYTQERTRQPNYKWADNLKHSVKSNGRHIIVFIEPEQLSEILQTARKHGYDLTAETNLSQENI
jgi:hypothetical protein